MIKRIILIILLLTCPAYGLDTGWGTIESSTLITVTMLNNLHLAVDSKLNNDIMILAGSDGKAILDSGGNYIQWPAASAGSLEKIYADNSEIEIIDTGYGYAEVVIDSEQQMKISDGYAEVIDGFAFRTITTTDGHTTKWQVYDSNGSTWRDVLTFENGDSSDSDTNNHPRIHLGANTALTGLGNMAVGMTWGNTGVPLTSNQDLEYAGVNNIYKVNGAIQVNFPAASDCIETGKDAPWVQYILIGSDTVSINPDGTEKLRSVSTTTGVLAAGNELDLTGPGVVTCVFTDDVEDGSSTDGAICWSNKELSDGGAS